VTARIPAEIQDDAPWVIEVPKNRVNLLGCIPCKPIEGDVVDVSEDPTSGYGWKVHLLPSDGVTYGLRKAVPLHPYIDVGTGFSANLARGILCGPAPSVLGINPHNAITDQEAGTLGRCIPEDRSDCHSAIKLRNLHPDPCVIP
jgi:hypothetical protein